MMQLRGGNPEYLGDGVYATHDGYQIWLQTSVDGVNHYVAIEPLVFKMLMKYARGLDWHWRKILDEGRSLDADQR